MEQERAKFLEKFKKMDAEERKVALDNPYYRGLIRSTGASVTLFSGEVSEGKTIKQKLSHVYLGLIERLNAKSGKREGIGALGGLSERICKEKFEKLSAEERMDLVGKKDNVILDKNNDPQFTRNKNIINFNNVYREVTEELGNLGIYDADINFGEMKQTLTTKLRDDNYAINIWKGQGEVLAVDPNCFTLNVDANLLKRLSWASHHNRHEENSEAKSLILIPLFEALGRFGKTDGQQISEDGRDMERDYRYPHEWLNSWKIASDVLEHNPEDMKNLATEVQAFTKHSLSFKKTAEKMGVDLDYVAQMIKVKSETIQTMESNFQVVYQTRANSLGRRKSQGK